MKIKTSELIGLALDWAVAKCEGHDVVVLTVEEQRQRWFAHVPPQELDKEVAEFNERIAASMKPKLAVLCEDGYKRAPIHEEATMLFNAGPPVFAYSTSWAQGGPIIEREGPWVRELAVASPTIAHLVTPDKKWFAHAKHGYDGAPSLCYYGGTFLIAAMRCYVASKLGDEVDVPEELLK